MITRTDSLPNSTAQTVSNAVRSLLGNRRGLLVIGAVVLVLGLAFKWNWLVAAGIAPLLLTALPCVAMCALGLCMNKMMGGSSGSQPSATDVTSEVTGPLLLAAPLHGSGNQEPGTAAASVEPTRSADQGCCNNLDKRTNHHA